MTWVQRLEAIGVVTLAFAGMLSAVAATLGIVPVAPPQVVEGFLGLLAITKAAAAAGGLLGFLSGRS